MIAARPSTSTCCLLLVGEALLGLAFDFERLRPGFDRHGHQLDRAPFAFGQLGQAPIDGVRRGIVLAHVVGSDEPHALRQLGDDLHVVRRRPCRGFRR